jgi:hypothetical protein
VSEYDAAPTAYWHRSADAALRERTRRQRARITPPTSDGEEVA